MAWEIIEQEQHRGWIGLGEPSFKLAPRRSLGLDDARPMPMTVCNFIYRLDAKGIVSASKILVAWHKVASLDWSKQYGWEPEHWETMVDPNEVGNRPDHVAGYCFRRSGYRSLGMTTGRSARRPPGHTRGPRVWCDANPKLVLYRGPLHRVPAA